MHFFIAALPLPLVSSHFFCCSQFFFHIFVDLFLYVPIILQDVYPCCLFRNFHCLFNNYNCLFINSRSKLLLLSFSFERSFCSLIRSLAKFAILSAELFPSILSNFLYTLYTIYSSFYVVGDFLKTLCRVNCLYIIKFSVSDLK